MEPGNGVREKEVGGEGEEGEEGKVGRRRRGG